CSDAALPAVKRPELARAVVERVNEVLPGTVLEIVAGKSQATLPDFYRAADLLLLTSANEGSPNVVKEALACNLPVISTRVGNVEELLEGLQNCHVCRDDPESLAVRVIEVLRSGVRTVSRERVASYSLECTSAAILEIYQEICKPDWKEARIGAGLERTSL